MSILSIAAVVIIVNLFYDVGKLIIKHLLEDL